METALARIGIDLHIFDILAGSDTPLSSSTLAEKTGIDLPLMSMSLVQVAYSCSLTFQRTSFAMFCVTWYDQ